MCAIPLTLKTCVVMISYSSEKEKEKERKTDLKDEKTERTLLEKIKDTPHATIPDPLTCYFCLLARSQA